MKRPFILLFLISILISIFSIFHTEELLLEKEFTNKASIVCTGTIYQITPKSKTTAIYIKNIKISSIKNKKIKKENYGITGLLIYTEQAENLKIKNQVKIKGDIQRFTKGTNPGQFNEYIYYKSLRIDYKVLAKNVSIVNNEYAYFANKLQEIRSILKQTYQKFLPEEDAGILCAMLLGDKSSLPQETKELYQKNGIAHILAISGLHISMIGLFLYKFLKKIYIPNEINIPCTILFLFSYAQMTGFSVSTNRATIMLTISLCAILLGRTYDFVTAICLSGTIILLQNPYQLVNCGFLLSFGAVLGISVVYPIIKKCIFPSEEKNRKVNKTVKSIHIVLFHWTKKEKGLAEHKKWRSGKKIIYKLVDAFLISLSVNLITLPILLYFYYDFPIYSIFLNLLILPFVSLLIALAVLLAFIGMFSEFFAMFFAGGIHAIFVFYEKVCNLTISLPNSIITIGKPQIEQLVIYYSLIFLAIFIYNVVPKLTIPIMFICCLSIFVATPSNSLSITVMDVGQGDGILLRNETGTTYFIDGGSTDIKNLGQYRITPCLKAKGISYIDYALVTHMDQDHISGLMELLEKQEEPGVIQIGTLILPNTDLKDDAFLKMIKLAMKKNINVTYLKKGDKIIDGELSLSCLHPYKGFNTTERNAYSMVLYMKYHSFSMLFTGDVEKEGEEALIANKELPKCDIYKVAHHGSQYTNSDSLLDRLQPHYAIVSAGEGNRYGHPHKEVLQRLASRKCPCFSTIDHGAIEVCITKDKINVSGYSSVSTLPFPKKKLLGEIQKKP